MNRLFQAQSWRVFALFFYNYHFDSNQHDASDSRRTALNLSPAPMTALYAEFFLVIPLNFIRHNGVYMLENNISRAAVGEGYDKIPSR